MSKRIEVREHIAALAKSQLAILEKYPDYDFPPEIADEAKARNDEITALNAELKRLEENERVAKELGAQEAFFNHVKTGIVQPAPAAKSIVPSTLGGRFTASEEWKEFYSRIAPGGYVSEKVRIDSPKVELGNLLAKTLITGASDTSGGALVFNDVQSGIVPLPQRPLAIRSVITNGNTTSDTVEFVRVTGYTNAAAVVAEATATAGASGEKPESALALEKVTTPVRTIAHWIPATTRALQDAAQLRTLIDAFLRDGLEQELEDELVNGDGTGEHFTGIANTANTQSQAFATDLLTTLRSARTLVRTVGRDTPTAYLMHPNDWQDVDLLQDNEGRYYFGGPRDIAQPRLWGLPVVECEAVTEGTAYVGNFRQCVIWDRDQGGIQVSNSHADFFIRNLIAILAEMRAAFGVLRPQSIVEIDLTA